MYKVSVFHGASEEWGPQVIPLFTSADPVFEKLAAPSLLPSVAQYISELRPVRDSQYVLVNAMGASEFYGSNINADAFPEASLIHCPDGWKGIPAYDRVAAKNWPYGFPTFYNAHPYAHHRNKDSTRAYGEVELAAWNDHMKRVELVIRADLDKCMRFGGQAVWDKLKMGMFVDVSMGSKVPFDTCAICLDWDAYRKAQATFDPRIHKHPGEAVLAYHRKLVAERGHGIQGLSITRKDYCFPPGTPVLLADGSYRPIERVYIGDLVRTHTGAVQPVLRVSSREIAEELVTIKTYCLGDVRSTEEHPYLVARTRANVHGGRVGQLDKNPPQWVAAEDIRPRDVVFLPIPTIEESAPYEVELGWLLGLYLAEGNPHFSKGVAWPKAIEFTLHGNEREVIDSIVQAARKIDPDLTWRLVEYDDAEAVGVCVNSRPVAEWLVQHGGRGSHTKTLAACVWSYGKYFAHAVLLGWAQGDGSLDSERSINRAFSASYDLAHQMQLLAAGVGILAGISFCERETNYGHQEGWYLHFCGDAAAALMESRGQQVFEKQSKLFFWKNYLCSTVRSVKRTPYAGTVHNMEVAQDNSYVVGCLSVHNCNHMKQSPNRILHDGRKVFVYNDYPRFFDISFVFIGADKTAKVMLHIKTAMIQVPRQWELPGAELAEKLGYEDVPESTKQASIDDELLKAAFLGKSALAKRGEMEKDVVPQFSPKSAITIGRCERDIPSDVLDTMARDVDKSLSTASTLGIVLKPKEFQRIIIVRLGLGPVADDFERKRIVFPKTNDSHDVPLSLGHFDKRIADILADFTSERSAFGPIIERRIIHASRVPEGTPKRYSSLSSKLLSKIGAAYNGYRRSLMKLAREDLRQVHDLQPKGQKLAMSSEAMLSPEFFDYIREAHWEEVGTDG